MRKSDILHSPSSGSIPFFLQDARHSTSLHSTPLRTTASFLLGNKEAHTLTRAPGKKLDLMAGKSGFSSSLSTLLVLVALLPISMPVELAKSTSGPPLELLLQPQNHPRDATSNSSRNQETLDSTSERRRRRGLASSAIITGNSTLLSPNRTFELGFFTLDGGSHWYLGIWYASIPIRTYVWLANRGTPVRGDSMPATASITADGRLQLIDGQGTVIWTTDNVEGSSEAKLLDTGNLVLFSPDRARFVWQSFDFPADTWLPDMKVTARRPITCWRSPVDPSPGSYSLRFKPPDYGEFELVYSGSIPIPYWSTGNWTGDRFAGVPEMTVPYIYTFRFDNAFTPQASFVYGEAPPPDSVLRRALTRFTVDSAGQLRQYTWFSQTASWNMFWCRPEDPCRAYALCGNLGCCRGGTRPCECLNGFLPADPSKWSSGDFSAGCRREIDRPCESSDAKNDEFEEIGAVQFDGATGVSIPGASREICEDSCRGNCSCLGLNYAAEEGICRNLYGSLLNLRNSTEGSVLYVRASVSSNSSEKGKWWRNTAVLAGGISGLMAVSGLAVLIYAVLRRRRRRRRERGEEEAVWAVANLQVFSYKELSESTRGFSEKLGHGGFGAVFQGTLPDSSLVAVKRLERPGGGDREFRAEVRTIGSIQHVNLVRLRGFCSEDPHRLLVYEYMPNGSLSAYLGRMGHPSRQLSWESRFRVALGTARGIAYLHEECRDCIVHCDIKPENILLDGDFTPKISDFGLAKLIGRDFSRVLATMRGTWGYVAPEWISGVAITAKADVYSYGMTLLEIVGGRRNVDAPPPLALNGEPGVAEEKWFFPPWAARRIVEGDVGGVVDPRLAGNYDKAEAERAGLVAVWCIQDQEDTRPTMGSVVKMLEGTVVVTTPPLPQLLQALVSGDSFPRAGIASGSVSHSTSTCTHVSDDTIRTVGT